MEMEIGASMECASSACAFAAFMVYGIKAKRQQSCRTPNLALVCITDL
jgi:hypothetical protein